MLKLALESDELLAIDALRVVGTVLVVVIHAAGYLSRPIDLTMMRHVVDLFFVISGYVIAFVYSSRLPKQYLSFLRARIAPWRLCIGRPSASW